MIAYLFCVLSIIKCMLYAFIMGSCCAKTALPSPAKTTLPSPAKTALPEQDSQCTVFAVPYGITLYQKGGIEPTDQPQRKQSLLCPTVRFSNCVTVFEWR